jgi:hypothetical protein
MLPAAGVLIGQETADKRTEGIIRDQLSTPRMQCTLCLMLQPGDQLSAQAAMGRW